MLGTDYKGLTLPPLQPPQEEGAEEGFKVMYMQQLNCNLYVIFLYGIALETERPGTDFPIEQT